MLLFLNCMISPQVSIGSPFLEDTSAGIEQDADASFDLEIRREFIHRTRCPDSGKGIRNPKGIPCPGDSYNPGTRDPLTTSPNKAAK